MSGTSPHVAATLSGHAACVIITMAKKHWIQKAIDDSKKGSLRKELHVKKGHKIPKAELEKDAHKPGILGKRARLALALED